MSFVPSFFRRATSKGNSDLNAAVKADFYVNAGDNKANASDLEAQSNAAKAITPTKSFNTSNTNNCCANAFRSICVKSPFGIFCTAAICWNVPAIILALTDLSVLKNGCHASIWLLVNAVCAGVHIATAIYIAAANGTTSTKIPLKNELPSDQRKKCLLCFNSKVACYLWFVVLYAAFTFVPLLLHFQDQAQDLMDKYSKNSNANGGNNGYNYGNDDYNANGGNNNSNSDYASLQSMNCHHFSHEKVIVAMGFAWAFLLMGGAALAISYCVAYNVESAALDDDNGTTALNSTNGGAYTPPSEATSNTTTTTAAAENTVEQPQECHGTVDDEDEVSATPPVNRKDPVVTNPTVTPPRVEEKKETAIQASAVKDNATQTEDQQNQLQQKNTTATSSSTGNVDTSFISPTWSQNFAETLNSAIPSILGRNQTTSTSSNIKEEKENEKDATLEAMQEEEKAMKKKTDVVDVGAGDKEQHTAAPAEVNSDSESLPDLVDGPIQVDSV